MQHLLIVDASGFAFRAYYTKSPQYRDDGAGATGATEVFIGMVWRMLGRAFDADPPTAAFAIFDPPEGNWRHKIFPAYKALRDPARSAELEPQFPIMREVAKVMGMIPLVRNGFEADDVVATLARRAFSKGFRVTIVSSDKDFAQLVQDGAIEIVDPMKRQRVLEADVIKKFGVRPALVPDVQALMGDSVDGIPGLRGWGKEAAGGYVRRFGSLEGVLKNEAEVRPMHRIQLQRSYAIAGTERTGREWAVIFKKLATLRTNVPLRIDLAAQRYEPPLKADLLAILKRLGAAGRAEAILNLDPQYERVVEKDEKALAWWREELKHPGQRIGDDPQCGYYQTKLVRYGPFVPARIWREPAVDEATGKPTGQEILLCHVASRSRDARNMWPRLAMFPISLATYNAMMKEHGAGQPPKPAIPTTPEGKTDWKNMTTPSFKRKKDDAL